MDLEKNSIFLDTPLGTTWNTDFTKQLALTHTHQVSTHRVFTEKRLTDSDYTESSVN